MDTLEQGIQNIDKLTKESIKKYEDLLAKTLYDTAQKSNNSSQSFDRNCNKIFKDAKDFGTRNNELFNPHTVVEFREGEAYQFIETWDKYNGILPNRKIMGTYYVDVGNDKTVSYYESDKFLRCAKHGGKIIMLTCKMCNKQITNLNCNHSINQFTPNCGCNYQEIDYNLYRGETRSKFLYNNIIQFEIDNYLNIYHKDTGLYLMLHKTTFPDICFYIVRECTQLPDTEYYQIYRSKRLQSQSFSLNQNQYKFKHQYETMLKNINELVPDTYERVFKLFDNFRKFQSFGQSENTPILELETQSEESNQLDPRDRIIEGLKLKLNETVKRCENSESILSDMVEKFNEKSTQIQHIEREKNLLSIKLKEQEVELEIKLKEMELNIEKNKLSNSEELTKISEEKDREAFTLYERLNEAEVFKAKSESIGISMSNTQKDLEKTQLEQKKLKDINIGITHQIKQEKERNSKLKTDNEGLIKQISDYQIKTQDLEKRKDELENELGDKINECYELHNKLSSLGSESSNALENALSDQIDDLQNEIEELRNTIKETTDENKQIKIKYEKVMKNLSSLME